MGDKAALPHDLIVGESLYDYAFRVMTERDSLQSQLSEAMAHCERLRVAADKIKPWDNAVEISSESVRELWRIMSETPAQSLTALQCQAIDEFKDEIVSSVSLPFKIHIEVVCAVVRGRILRQAKSDEERSCMYSEYDEVE